MDTGTLCMPLSTLCVVPFPLPASMNPPPVKIRSQRSPAELQARRGTSLACTVLVAAALLLWPGQSASAQDSLAAELAWNQLPQSWTALFGSAPPAGGQRAWEAARRLTPLGEEPLHRQSGLSTPELADALNTLHRADVLSWELALLRPWVESDARAVAWSRALERTQAAGATAPQWLDTVTSLRAAIAWSSAVGGLHDACNAADPDAAAITPDQADTNHWPWYRPSSPELEPAPVPEELPAPLQSLTAALASTNPADPALRADAGECVTPALAALALEAADAATFALHADGLTLVLQRDVVPDVVVGRLAIGRYLAGDRLGLRTIAAALPARADRLYDPLQALLDGLTLALDAAAGDTNVTPEQAAALALWPEVPLRWVHAELLRHTQQWTQARQAADGAVALDPFFAPAFIARAASWVQAGFAAEAFADLAFLERVWGASPLYGPQVAQLAARIR